MTESQTDKLLGMILRYALAADARQVQELAADGLTMLRGSGDEAAEAWNRIERATGTAPRKRSCTAA